MTEPVVKREGNLRFAGLSCPGYPEDPAALVAVARGTIESQGLSCHGPPVLLFTMPPYGPPSAWECQAGTAITGLGRAERGVSIEDYAGLVALILPHPGAIADLAQTHKQLVEHGRAHGYVIRPYWRLALWRRRLSDGNILPSTEVSIFVDRW